MGWSGEGDGEISKGCTFCSLTKVVSTWSYWRFTKCTTIGTTIGGIRLTIVGTVASTTRGTTTTREARGIDQFGGLDECHGGVDG